jgi:hypothetical protein
MTSDFEAAFASLKSILAKHAKKFTVTADTATDYTLYCKSPSPFKQHKGQPLYFAGVRVGKAYVSFHLLPLYMSPMKVPAGLKKRMQGKACFNFKTAPDKEQLAELKQLTADGLKVFSEKKWL